MSEKRTVLKKESKRTLILLASLILSCIVVYGLYRFLIATVNPEAVLIAYMAVSTVVIFWYVIYNRGFSRKGITPEMLPASWDEEKNTAFKDFLCKPTVCISSMIGAIYSPRTV